MARVFRILGLLLLLIIAFLGWRGWQTFYGTPSLVDTMATRQFAQYLMRDPAALTTLGIIDGSLLDLHSGKLTPQSQAYRDSLRALVRQFREEIDRYDVSSLSDDQALTHGVWASWLDAAIDVTEPFYGSLFGGPYVVDQYTVQILPDLLTRQHSLKNKKLADNYLKRLNASGDMIDQIIEVFNDHADRGAMAPRPILERVISDIDAFTAPLPGESPLVKTFREKLSGRTGFKQGDVDQYAAQAETMVETIVYPAYARLKSAVENRLDEARTENVGVSALPDGYAYYAARIRQMTTVAHDPDRLHKLGVQEVARLNEALESGLEQLGYVEGGIHARVQQFFDDNLFGFPDTSEGRDQLTAEIRRMIERANAVSQDYFSVFPKASVEVRLIPEYAAASANNSYSRPAKDGSRPGYFNINGRRPSQASRVGLPSLTFHETIPGHHHQIALAQELDLSLLRQNLPFTAYSEGWALYVETIADEMGYYDNDPVGAVGAILSELFRARRLVVDTGLHAKAWSRDEAAQYMAATIGTAEGWAREIDRYLVTPGQALAYKVGELKITGLRAKAEAALGDGFDIRTFHDEILSDGAVPLDVLESKIDAWIEQELLSEQLN